MKTIFVMGANPAWQKTLVFQRLKTGAVNRAVSMEVYPAGKGVNVCRAAACFGTAETRLFQFAGGTTGQRLCTALDELGIRHETVETRHETRTCVTCLDHAEGSMTELIEPSGAVSETEAENFLQILKEQICEASVFVISGSLPDGTDASLYRRATEIAVAAGVPVIADAVKGIEAVLDLPGRIILKVNREEFFKITGCSETGAPDGGKTLEKRFLCRYERSGRGDFFRRRTAFPLCDSASGACDQPARRGGYGNGCFRIVSA